MSGLNRLVAAAIAEAGGPHPCGLLGHRWKMIGGCNAGCSDDCACSIPVHECEVCGDCDYGDNKEAREHMEQCSLRAA